MNAEESYYVLKFKLQKFSDDDHKLFSFIADLPRISNKVLRIARFFPGINTNKIKIPLSPAEYIYCNSKCVSLKLRGWTETANHVLGKKYEIENASSNYIICHAWKRAPKRRGVRT